LKVGLFKIKNILLEEKTMKKIVAIVLSLVMVLGLATTAFAAKTTTYEGLYAKDTNTLTETADVSIEIVPAVAPKYNTDGTLKAPGKVEEVLIKKAEANVALKAAGLVYLNTNSLS
jgi:uncharacterized protein YxeA